MRTRSLTFILAFFNILSVYSQTVDGIFTIGNDGDDFSTFTESVEFLSERGIHGDVEIIVAPGVYTEHILIEEIIGASENAKIYYRSSTRNPKDVVLQHKHTQAAAFENYTIYLDGTDYISFSDMTIEALSETPTSGFNRVLYVPGASNHISFKNNIFNSFPNGDSDCIVIGSPGQSSACNSHFSLENNLIDGGVRGLYMIGASNDDDYMTSNWSVKGNKFINQSEGGMHVQKVKDASIEGNEIIGSMDAALYWRGMVVQDMTGDVLVNANRIFGNNGGSGIHITRLNDSHTPGTKIVSNNSINLQSTIEFDNTIGFRLYLNEKVTIAHNCIYQNKNNRKTILIDVEVDSTLIDKTVFKNNHLVHEGNGTCIRYNNATPSPESLDYNNYFTVNGTIAEIEYVSYNTFSEFQNLGVEPNGLNIDPKFSRADLLIATNNLVFDNGVSTSVLKDQFGNLRSNSNPDIGIYEGLRTSYDVGIASFAQLDRHNCELKDDLSITIKNYASEILNTVLIKVDIGNGQVLSKVWNGVLSEGEESSEIIFEDVELISNINTRAWTELPNEKVDIFTGNDTLEFEFINSISGTFTVGNAQADYESMTDAIEDLVKRGMCGPITFNILPGVYTEYVFVPKIRGSSTINTLTIQSLERDRTSVLFNGYNEISGNDIINYFFRFDDTEHVNLRHLSFNATGFSGKTNSITVTGNASNLNFSDLRIAAGNSSSSLNFLKGSIIINQDNAKNILIENCHFDGGVLQLRFLGYTSLSTSENIVVRNNTFDGNGSTAIRIEGMKKILFKENIILGERSNAGIYIRDCYSGIEIVKNRINLTDGIGIIVDQLTTTIDDPFLMVNNFISVNSHSAIQIDKTTNSKILHNNFHNGLIKLEANYIFLEKFEFINNIVSVPNGISPYDIGGSDLGILEFSNNLIFLDREQENGVYYKGDLITFEQWQSVLGQDINSVFANPKFISDNDLHLFNTVALNGKGLPNTGITTDIDDEERDLSAPDIGADEITIDSILIKDLSLESFASNEDCDLTNSIDLIIKNNAISKVDSFFIQYSIFEKESTLLKFEQTIEPGEEINQRVADYLFNTNTLYDLKFEVIYPDGQIDDNFNNNTLTDKYYRITDVEIFKDIDEKCDNSLSLFIHKPYNTNIEWSNGVTYHKLTNVLPGLYTIKLTTADGCEVSDSINIE